MEQTTAADGHWRVVMFGLTDPDGRDTEAAAHCSLRVLRASRVHASSTDGEAALRLGLAAGSLLVDATSSEPLRDRRYEQLIHVAKRLAGRAKTGQLLAADDLEGALHRYFDVRTVTDAVAVEGERELGEDVGRFLGRRAPLRLIGELLAKASRGQQQIIGLVAEAGGGKSRFLSEVHRRLRGAGHDVGFYVTTVPRQGRTVPLSGCQETLRVLLGIDDLEPEPLVRDKVLRLRELGLSQPALRAVEVALGLRGASEQDSEQSRRPLGAALGRIATRLAEDRLTVFAFDGVDGMDDESVAILTSLLTRPSTAPLAVIMTMRTSGASGFARLPNYTEVRLEPLSDEEILSLAAGRLLVDEVPMPLLRDLTIKSSGNPLYAEEYLAALTDAGAVVVEDGQVSYRPDVAEVKVPKSLRGIVSARVARLGPVHRHVLQIASVVGSRFGVDVIARVSGEPPHTVTRAFAVLEGRGLLVRSGAIDFEFAHELAVEVLRDSLPLESLRGLNGAVALALEELHPHRVDELAERLAAHWRAAGELGRAAEYLIRSADRRETEELLPQALDSLCRAIEVLRALPSPDRDQMLHLYRRIGELALRSRRLVEGSEAMAAALELAEGIGREAYVARFSMMRGRLLAGANRFEEGRKWLTRARDVARGLNDHELLRDIAIGAAEAYTKNGANSIAITLLREALSLTRETSDVATQIRCLASLALAYGLTGDHQAAQETLAEARSCSRLQSDRYTTCELLKVESLIEYYQGHHQAAVAVSERAFRLAQEAGFFYEAAVNAHNMGEGFVRMSEWRRAFAWLRRSFELAKEHGFPRLEHLNLRVLGFIDAVRFGSEEGRQRIIQSARYAETEGLQWDLLQAHYLLGLAESRLGRSEEARRYLREALRLAADSGDARYHKDAQAALVAVEAGEPAPLPG